MLYFLRYGVSKAPHTSVTFRRILLVCIKTVFSSSVIFVSIPMVFNLFSSSLAGVPRAPTTNGTTITFIFHTFFSSLARSKYLSIFSTSLSSPLVSYGIAKSIIWHSWCFLSIKIMSGLLAVIKRSVCTVNSQSVLHESCSMTASDWCSYHFDLTWIPISQWICLPTQSCLLLYSLWASLGHSLTMWLIVSSALLHILHFACSCYLSIFPLITLVRMACSWAANIKLSVSRFRVPFLNHCHLSWFPTSLVCYTNWPCNIFSS